jgi:hypothetical protein
MTKSATLWGAQFAGILENVTSKMKHEENEGTRRCPIEFLRVPSWFVHCQREPRLTIELADANTSLGSPA